MPFNVIIVTAQVIVVNATWPVSAYLREVVCVHAHVCDYI